MASKLTSEEESSKTKKNLDGWKFPKVPIDQVYKNKVFSLFTSYVVKDFQDTITLKAANQNVTLKLVSEEFLYGFIKKKHSFLHLGLVQIAVKPLIRDGLGSPIIVCLGDNRHSNFQNSLLALVESNLSEGHFYFNCFPSFSVSLADTSSFEALRLCIKTGGIPMALTYRIVCKAMVNLSSGALREPVLNETPFFQPETGTQSTTKWSEVEVPESWTCKPEPKAKDPLNGFRTLSGGRGRVLVRYQSAGQADNNNA